MGAEFVGDDGNEGDTEGGEGCRVRGGSVSLRIYSTRSHPLDYVGKTISARQIEPWP